VDGEEGGGGGGSVRELGGKEKGGEEGRVERKEERWKRQKFGG